MPDLDDRDPENGQAQYDELPPEAVDHLIAAFKHKAGLGPHPGKYQGPRVKDPNSVNAKPQRAARRAELIYPYLGRRSLIWATRAGK